MLGSSDSPKLAYSNWTFLLEDSNPINKICKCIPVRYPCKALCVSPVPTWSQARLAVYPSRWHSKPTRSHPHPKTGSTHNALQAVAQPKSRRKKTVHSSPTHSSRCGTGVRNDIKTIIIGVTAPLLVEHQPGCTLIPVNPLEEPSPCAQPFDSQVLVMGAANNR